jgi:hypothetical protein
MHPAITHEVGELFDMDGFTAPRRGIVPHHEDARGPHHPRRLATASTNARQIKLLESGQDRNAITLAQGNHSHHDQAWPGKEYEKPDQLGKINLDSAK